MLPLFFSELAGKRDAETSGEVEEAARAKRGELGILLIVD